MIFSSPTGAISLTKGSRASNAFFVANPTLLDRAARRAFDLDLTTSVPFGR